jgi:hypothetical protein
MPTRSGRSCWSPPRLPGDVLVVGQPSDLNPLDHERGRRPQVTGVIARLTGES